MRSESLSSSPTVSAARAAAFDILLRVEHDSSYASELLHSRTHESLDPVDHSLATELVMGVLRWQSLLDSEIAQISSQPLSRLDLEVLVALRLAVYQLQWLSRIPARAAIHESVQLVKRARKRSAAPFVNAVLRKMIAVVTSTGKAAQVRISGASAQSLADSSAHPQWLVERWIEAYGLDSALRICQYDQTVPGTAIRLRDGGAAAQLEAEGIGVSPGALLAAARRVSQADVAASSSAFRSGMFVIQDEASQLIAALVGQGERILDCCAAPGGKTLAILDANPSASLVALDLHPHRARLLRTLLRVQNSTAEAKTDRVRVAAADARNFPFATKFDRVLVDAPCSGTGTLARNPEIKWRLIPGDLADLQQRQIAILRSAMDHVTVGGQIIYSTCSLEREENEQVVERCLAENPSFLMRDCRIELRRIQQEGELTWPDLSSLTRGFYLRTVPGEHPCDGFFAAILEKI